jgi:hypothetical protein
MNACVLPKSIEAVRGVTLTLTKVDVGTGGGGWTADELVTTLPQPKAQPAVTSTARVRTVGKRLCGAL